MKTGLFSVSVKCLSTVIEQLITVTQIFGAISSTKIERENKEPHRAEDRSLPKYAKNGITTAACEAK